MPRRYDNQTFTTLRHANLRCVYDCTCHLVSHARESSHCSLNDAVPIACSAGDVLDEYRLRLQDLRGAHHSEIEVVPPVAVPSPIVECRVTLARRPTYQHVDRANSPTGASFSRSAAGAEVAIEEARYVGDFELGVGKVRLVDVGGAPVGVDS